MKKTSFILFLFYTFVSFSQSELQIELGIGYAFQGEMVLDNQNLENTEAFGVRFGLNYLKKINKSFYVETGIFGKYNRGSKSIEILDFVSNSLKVQVPLYVGYQINNKWRFSLGTSLENNKDANKIDFKTEHNLRYDFLTKLVYIYNPKMQFSFYSHWMMNNVPDTFTISNPKNGVYLSLIYLIKKK